jgi:hypothetical protein
MEIIRFGKQCCISSQGYPRSSESLSQQSIHYTNIPSVVSGFTISYIRYCSTVIVNKSISSFWWVYTFWTPHLTGESGSWNTISVYLLACMYMYMYVCTVCMGIRLTNTWTVERILFLFGFQESIHHRPVLGDYKYSSSKIRDASNGPRKRKLRCSRKRLLTHSLTHSWSWALLEKLPVVQPLKNFPAFYGTRRFITAFKRALH